MVMCWAIINNWLSKVRRRQYQHVVSLKSL